MGQKFGADRDNVVLDRIFALPKLQQLFKACFCFRCAQDVCVGIVEGQLSGSVFVVTCFDISLFLHLMPPIGLPGCERGGGARPGSDRGVAPDPLAVMASSPQSFVRGSDVTPQRPPDARADESRGDYVSRALSAWAGLCPHRVGEACRASVCRACCPGQLGGHPRQCSERSGTTSRRDRSAGGGTDHDRLL